MGPNKPLGAAAQSTPAYLKKAGISQNLGNQLPLNDHFLDSSGADVPLGAYFEHRPVVMALVYYKCKMLCPQVLSGLARTLRQVGFIPGKDYDIVITSIDPADTPADGAAEKVHFLDSLGTPDAGASVHFLTGQQASITDLASATGFNYVRVPGPDGKMDQFAHSSVIMIATPDGRMSKYLFGIDYQPRDVRLAVIQASNHHIGSLSDLSAALLLQLQSQRRQVHGLHLAGNGPGRDGVSVYAGSHALRALPQAEANHHPRLENQTNHKRWVLAWRS